VKPNRMGLYIRGEQPLHYALEMARYAEERGFSELWIADPGRFRDCVVMMSTILSQTKRIKVGSGIIPIWTHNPVTLSVIWSTMYELGPGRPMMGLGAWYEPIASNVGVQRIKPLKAMREYVEAIHLLFTSREVNYSGEFVNINYMQINPNDQGMTPLDIPVYIGATGSKMHELAGEIADGVMMNYFVPPSYIRMMVKSVQQGAEKAGRDWEQIDRPELIAVAVSEDRKVALDAARFVIAYYLGYEPHIMETSGANQQLLNDIHKITTWPPTVEKQHQAMQLIPDELVQNICAAGTPQECQQKVKEYIEAGCTCPILSPLTDNIELLIDSFTEEF